MSLHLPRHFERQDPAALQALLHAHPLATWVCVVDGEPVINHLPLHLDATRGEHGTPIGHVARANPVWQSQPTSSVCIFHGLPRFIHEKDALHARVSRLTDRHEAGRAHPRSVNDAPRWRGPPRGPSRSD